MRKLLALTLLAGLAACGGRVPPAMPSAPREPAVVNASIGRTWDALVDAFAEQNISIRTMDRASGFIAAEPMSVSRPRNGETALADCGTISGLTLYPDAATWNVLIRGDSTRSTVRATVRFVNSAGLVTECASRGIWETDLEAKVKVRAEMPG